MDFICPTRADPASEVAQIAFPKEAVAALEIRIQELEEEMEGLRVG